MVSELRRELEGLRVELLATLEERKTAVDQTHVDSIIQQHQIDLLTTWSQIRALESRVFEEESHSLGMLNRVENLQDELRGAKEALRQRKNTPLTDSPNPAIPSSSSFAVPQATVGSSSETCPQSTSKKTNFLKMIDESNLSEQTKQTRTKSLNLLKTQMENDLGLLNLSSNALSHHPPDPSNAHSLKNW
ncbi:uncharacterized protein PGTG_03021 [Puccinia graminis f. sp. tritici CRL 75-36-700-3]|uniref:Uncharacterized protein n=1 Tax=Puccinia graminis f. sp. tritici (strain CRL 75-36-700-3 / race SCCL) TaxID=418459 RepID=E3JYE0_PUCGT|nr:uncharacterized protein PGTG_03021 [Puccinia graminis f. sp. tritici CRL 75-36-700-3]EFP77065.1 hypothetical protein PGTG_03021 [Puccinia graminis f. sp. tritici CRL 75-36-700-3]